jgi:hypothetical protein
MSARPNVARISSVISQFILSVILLAAGLFITPPAFGPPAFAADANAPAKTAHATEPGVFQTIALSRPGMILMADSGDIDGDGAVDLLLFHKPSKESYEKSCSVYFQRGGTFAPQEPLIIYLGEKVGATCVADIDSDGRDELCAFDSGGMIVFGLPQKLPGEPDAAPSIESARTLRHPTLLPAAARRMAKVNWIADLDADGKMDVILPLAEGLGQFMGKPGGGFAKGATLPLPTRASVGGDGGQNYVSYRLPEIEFADFDGDGRIDIGAFDFEQMSFFLSRKPPEPHRSVTSPLVRKFTKDFIASIDFSDLNGDAVPDAALVLVSQKKNLQSEARIYFGNKDLSYGEAPSHVYAGETSLIIPMFLDVTGDGKMEMLLQTVDVGFGFFLNYFIRDRIRVDTELRMLGEDGVYDEEPALRLAVHVKVSETGAEPARGTGDFNGDGLDDLAVGTAEDTLSFFLSGRESLMPKRPAFRLNVPAYGKLETLDLNGDARDDIVILYKQDDLLGTAIVLLSR